MRRLVLLICMLLPGGAFADPPAMSRPSLVLPAPEPAKADPVPAAAVNPGIPIDACLACANGIGQAVAPTAWQKWGKLTVTIVSVVAGATVTTLESLHSAGVIGQ